MSLLFHRVHHGYVTTVYSGRTSVIRRVNTGSGTRGNELRRFIGRATVPRKGGGETGSPHTLISNIIGMWCVRGTEFFKPVSWSQRYGKSSGTLARDASKDKGYFVKGQSW